MSESMNTGPRYPSADPAMTRRRLARFPATSSWCRASGKLALALRSCQACSNPAVSRACPPVRGRCVTLADEVGMTGPRPSWDLPDPVTRLLLTVRGPAAVLRWRPAPHHAHETIPSLTFAYLSCFLGVEPAGCGGEAPGPGEGALPLPGAAGRDSPRSGHGVRAVPLPGLRWVWELASWQPACSRNRFSSVS